ncbi:N-acetyltransferase [Labrys miyagiensis]|uniref:N-acetyltransferase n=1 Tax=Labrys miyagiensis TaxID=346912 RepID=A0ABQ6CD06_9HYPH|nr:GNAT family N-acetyltransferase [Labrys miyagiensis]GLS18242.1 N-acetyltransferase [Labrys miyagiensis]
MTSVTIRLAEPTDAAYFPAIEQSAGELFRTIEDLAWIADSENLTDPHYAELIRCGASWVACTQDGRLIGFLCAEIMEHELHIHELAIVFDFQRQGIGRQLLDTAVAWAAESDLAGVTLTTFRCVAWNEHFYARAGFETLPENRVDPRLAAIMKFEIARGLPADRRCAMWRPLNRTLK